MIKFKKDNKGYITQYFGGSPASNPLQYTTRGTSGHSGVDSVIGWNKPVMCDNSGFIYKTIQSHQSSENWQGVYMLVEDGDTVVEVVQGHFNVILVEAGYDVPEGTVVGLEGNKGYVYSGGTRITTAMQQAGDKRGSHVHTSYRPVKKVTKKTSGAYYLLNLDGTTFKKDGYYFEIINKDNGYNGCINPFLYLYENSNTENLSLLSTLLGWLKVRYSK